MSNCSHYQSAQFAAIARDEQAMNRAPFDLNDNPTAAGDGPAKCLIGVADFIDDASVHAERWERHPAGDEALCVLEGRLLLSLKDHLGRSTRFTLEKGSAFVVPQGTWHRLQVLEPGRLAYFTPREGTSLRPGSERGWT